MWGVQSKTAWQPGSFPYDVDREAQELLQEGSRQQSQVSRSGTILLVDDDPDIRSLTRTFFETEGYEVFSASDADRAELIFRRTPRIDLLVTDLYMPGRSGMDLAVELKRHRSDLRVLLVSGGAMPDALRDRLREKGWNFLAKPFRFARAAGGSPCDSGAVRSGTTLPGLRIRDESISDAPDCDQVLWVGRIIFYIASEPDDKLSTARVSVSSWMRHTSSRICLRETI